MKIFEILKQIVMINALLVTSGATAKKTHHTHGLLRMNSDGQENRAAPASNLKFCKVTDDCAKETPASVSVHGCREFCQRGTTRMAYYFCEKAVSSTKTTCTLSKDKVIVPKDPTDVKTGETRRKYNPVECTLQTDKLSSGCGGYGASTSRDMCSVKAYVSTTIGGLGKKNAILVSNDYMGQDPMVCVTADNKCQRSNENCCRGKKPKCCDAEGYRTEDCSDVLPTVEEAFQEAKKGGDSGTRPFSGDGRLKRTLPGGRGY